MIISEKQINELIQISHLYLRLLDTLYKKDSSLLSGCGIHNKQYIAALLEEIANQQSSELIEIF